MPANPFLQNINNLDDLGNINSDYEHVQRYAMPAGLVQTENLVLKLYSSVEIKTEQDLEKTKNLKNIDDVSMDQLPLISSVKSFIYDEIKNKVITPEIGLGFGIISKNMLNISKWDKTYNTIPKQDLFIYHNMDILDCVIADPKEEGSYCIWELGIVEFEKEQWKKYLISQHTKEDKLKYLNNFIKGTL